MALKQIQSLKLLQKLSPQQIQLMKLLQLPTIALEQRIKEELETNPALEEGENDDEDNAINDELGLETETDDTDIETNTEETEATEFDDESDSEIETELRESDSVDLDDYMDEEEQAEYKYEANNTSPDDERKESPIVQGPDFHDLLEEQLGLRQLSEHEYAIGLYLIGNIDDDGYLRRDLEALVDDLAFTQNVNTTLEELKNVLEIIHTFDPAGVGARSLQECLLLQLDRKTTKPREVILAMEVVKHSMDEFSKKHYDKIKKKLEVEDEELKEIINEIIHLNPKPGGSLDSASEAGDVVPDFFVTINDGMIELSLNSRNAPELKLSKDYIEMLKHYQASKDKASKEAVSFVKQKLDTAQWFIEALMQRQQTLIFTMNAILEYQEAFFLVGDETKIKPMILKDIAEKTNLDISTVSRVANSKYVATPYGTYLLKYFFSESLSTEGGDEVSSREVKKILGDCIDGEDKQNPLTDDELAVILKEKGYNIARRTVAKYREQLGMPVARLRKEI
jgi:RNA polymerase sigma-54 factor